MINVAFRGRRHARIEPMKLGRIVERMLPSGVFRRLSAYYMRVKYFGWKYRCPFCGGSYRRFYPAGFDFPVLKEQDIVGAGLRENVRCPGCSSSNRERLIYLYLANEKGSNDRTLSVLHVAPEPRLQRLLKGRPNITHVSVDIASPDADRKMDIRKLEFPDESFDIVLCNHVLEHVPEDDVAMKEILRVLRPGGFAILQVPISLKLERTFEDPTVTDPKERERVFGQSDHIRIYARDYRDRLARAGFSVEVLDYAGKLGKEATMKYSLDPRESLYIATKKSGT